MEKGITRLNVRVPTAEYEALLARLVTRKPRISISEWLRRKIRKEIGDVRR